MAYSGSHNMGEAVRSNMKCPICTHKREFIYSKGIRFCWHCKHKSSLTREEYNQIIEENKLARQTT